LAKLHAVPYKEVGLKRFGKAGGYYIRQMKTFKAISEAQAATEDIKTGKKVGSVPHQKQLLKWFAKNLPNDQRVESGQSGSPIANPDEIKLQISDRN